MGKPTGSMHGPGALNKLVLAMSAMLPLSAALAQSADNAASSPQQPAATAPAASRATEQVDTVTINGVKRGELILADQCPIHRPHLDSGI